MTEKNFIKLHSSDDNSVIVARLSEIILICVDTDDNDSKSTTIYFDNETIEAISVNETPEKIYQNILDANNTDFLKLHSSDDNAVIVINTDSIALITQSEENSKKMTTMYFNNESIESVTFNESPERIYQMIEDTIENKKSKEKLFTSI